MGIFNFNMPTVSDMLMRIIPIVICLTFHELAHGIVSYRLGDKTAKEMGRLSLNPIRHIDPIGFIMLVLFRFGWAKPVMVNMQNFKNPKVGMGITALAGPVSNIILAMIMLFIYGIATMVVIGRLSPELRNMILDVFENIGFVSVTSLLRMLEPGPRDIILEIILNTAWISIVLAVFNMIPIPPLDGSKVFFSLLPESVYFKLMQVERYGFILLIIFINTEIFNRTVGHLVETIFRQLFPIARWAFNLVN